METILVLGNDPEARALFHEILSSRGYHVLEAANYQHADTILYHFGNSLDLILGCFHTDRDISNLHTWHTHRVCIPLLIAPASERSASESFAEDIALRVSFALGVGWCSKSIMVVVDDRSERIAIVDLLQKAGYDVAQAGNGREALALMANEPPDLLLTDIVMPEKDGLELIQDLRKLHLKTTIVATSGTARADGYLSIARLLGAKYTLRKPVAFDHLLRTLRAASCPDI